MLILNRTSSVLKTFYILLFFLATLPKHFNCSVVPFKEFIIKYINSCTPVVIVVTNDLKELPANEIINTLEATYQSATNPIFLFYMSSNELGTAKLIERPAFSKGIHCVSSFVALLKVNEKVLDDLSRFIIPVNDPALRKDTEKVLIYSLHSHLTLILKSPSFGKKLKHKIGFEYNLYEDAQKSSIKLYTACEFCVKKDIFPVTWDAIGPWLDFEKNFHQEILRVAAPTGTRPRLNYTTSHDGVNSPSTGLLVFALKYFQSKFNFTLKLLASTRSGGTGIKLANGSWTGAMGNVLYGEVDIAMCTAETFSRSLVADFSHPVIYEPVTFVSGQPQKVFVWYAMMWPFKPSVWTVLGLLLGISVGLIYFIGRTNQMPWRLYGVFEVFIGTLLGQSSKLPKKIPLVVGMYLSMWLLCGVVITTAYLSKLMGFLTFPSLERAPQTPEELAASKYECGLTFMGGAVFSLLKVSKIPSYVKIFGKMELMKDHLKCLTRTLDYKFVCISYETIPNNYMNSRLDIKPGHYPLYVSRNYLFQLPVGIAMEKRSVLAPGINDAVRSFVTAGLIEQWERMDFRNVRERARAETPKSLPAPSSMDGNDDINNEDILLTMKHLHGAFIILGTGLCLAMIGLSIEFISKRFLDDDKKRRMRG